MDSRDIKLLIAILLALAIAGTAWYFRDELLPQKEPPAAVPAETPVDDGEAKEGPRHPVAAPERVEPRRGELVALPPLDDSDAYFLLELANIFGSDIEVLLHKEAIIDRIVATVDNLPRGHVAEKVRPVGRLAAPFRTVAAGGDGPIYISPESYLRYQVLVGQIAAADINAIVDAYRRYYPLFQQSYERLGYPDGYFNDRVVEVIDHLLTAPEPEEPIRIVRPHVLYEFADPELESLSSGQKLLLRMGGDNSAVIKGVLRELRAELAR